MTGTDTESPDVLPAWIAPVGAVLWLTLFAGRWIAVPFLIAIRATTAVQVAALDEGPLIQCYRILLALTIIAALLRYLGRSKQTELSPSISRTHQTAAERRP